MKKSLLALAFLLSTSAFAQQTTIIKAGTLIDGTSAQPKHDQVIVIRGDRIESVGPAMPSLAGVLVIGAAVYVFWRRARRQSV